MWVILAYMIASTVLVLTAGRLSDLFGRKHAYVGGFVAFAAASLGAGFAGRRDAADRVADPPGHRRAFLFANAAALVTDAFPRASSASRWGPTRWSPRSGSSSGPVLGGALVSIAWQWVFWFNVPLASRRGLGGLILRELATPDTRRGLDLRVP